jgi:hypothetical protein
MLFQPKRRTGEVKPLEDDHYDNAARSVGHEVLRV